MEVRPSVAVAAAAAVSLCLVVPVRARAQSQVQSGSRTQTRPAGGPAPLRALAVLPDEGLAVAAATHPRAEPSRAVVEYLVSTAVFSAMNTAGALLLDKSSVHVASGGGVSLSGSKTPLIVAGSLFALSPFGAALSSYLVGRGSDDWRPGLLSPTLGAYGMSAVAVAAGLGIASTNVDRNTAIALNGALYLSVPLAAVLLQNAMKDPVSPTAPPR